MIVVKIMLNGEMRRFRIEENASFEQFYVLLKNLFCKENLDLYHIQYVDSDGDNVTVSCTMELEEAILQAKQISPSSPILRLSLTNRVPVNKDTPDSTVQVTVEYSPSRQRGSPFDLKIEETATSLLETQIIPTDLTNHISIGGTPNEPLIFTEETSKEISNERLITLSEETFSNCIQQSDQMVQLVSNYSKFSVSEDFQLAEINKASKNIEDYCSELSEKTFMKCMATSLESVPLSSEYGNDLCSNFSDASEVTFHECSRASDQIALGVLPLYEEIIGLCTRTSTECAKEILNLKEDDYNSLEGLDKLQNSLIESTVQSSLLVSDSILSSILAI
jgi:hypothetical protein